MGLKLNFCLENGGVNNRHVVQNISFFNKIFNQENVEYDEKILEQDGLSNQNTPEDVFTKRVKDSFVPRRYFSNIR